MFGVLDELRKSLCVDDKCSIACSSILLGSLIKQMHNLGFNDERPTSPFLGYSVDGFRQAIISFQTPQWCSNSSTNIRGYRHSHSYSCNLREKIESQAVDIVKELEGMKLSDYVLHSADVKEWHRFWEVKFI